MACKNKTKTNKMSHRKSQVNKYVSEKRLHSLSLFASDKFETFSLL